MSGTTGTISSNTNNYQYCYTASEGAVFYLPSGMSLSDTSSTFKQNAGYNSGQVYCDTCTATFTYTTFKDTLAKYGSIIYMKD